MPTQAFPQYWEQSVWLSTFPAQIEKGRKDSIHSIAFLQATCLRVARRSDEGETAALWQANAAVNSRKFWIGEGCCRQLPTDGDRETRELCMQGDNAKARTAYQDFLAAWKAADPDIPVLIAAKSEYTNLK